MKNIFKKMDLWLFFLTCLYSLLGLIMIFSASSVSAVLRYNYSTNYYFYRQLIFLLFAFIIGFCFIIKIPTKKYKYFIRFLIILIIGSLIYVLLNGKTANGAKSWIGIGSFGIQPTEFAKAILIVYMGVFFGDFLKKRNSSFSFLTPLIVGALLAVLVLLQPDLGGAIIIAGITFFVFIAIPMKKNNKIMFFKILGAGIIIAVIGLLAFGNNILNANQLKRLQFQNPCSRYTEDTGYQVCNGLIAVSNGGLFGLGLGNSTQKYLYLPEAHTDFIFSIVVEELGALGGLLVILGYIFMLYRILKIAKESEHLRGSIIAYGIFFLLIFHIFVNLMGVMGIIPLTGVPLPFLSYGGSFNMVIIILMFVLQRICIENKIIKSKKEIENMWLKQ